MRTEKEILDLVLTVAQQDERVRVVAMNGSRTNPKAPKDVFQDFDIVFLVTEMDSFLQNQTWIDVFGPRLIMQTPEDMSLFPPSLGGRYTYLMQFEDGNRIDLMLIPLSELESYLKEDKLTLLLLDKDKRVPPLPAPTDIDYHIQKPTEAYFKDCCNEFFWLTAYVVKGLCRGEILYALHHLEILRNEMLRMLSWQVGIETDFSVSVGKCYKYLEKYVHQNTYHQVLSTYAASSTEECWQSLDKTMLLFKNAAHFVASQLKFAYPYEEDANMTAYVQNWLKKNREGHV